MIEIVRRLFVVCLWLAGLAIATSSSIYFGSIIRFAASEGGAGEAVVGLALGVIIFFTFVGITYFIHKKILNYIFMVDTKKADGK